MTPSPRVSIATTKTNYRVQTGSFKGFRRRFQHARSIGATTALPTFSMSRNFPCQLQQITLKIERSLVETIPHGQNPIGQASTTPKSNGRKLVGLLPAL